MTQTFNIEEERKRLAVDMGWAKRVGGILTKHYPGHGWQVECDSYQGIIKILNRHMSPIQGYILNFKDVNLPTFDRDIMRIGGEILERFGLSRTRFEADVVREIQSKTMGRAKADMS